ncbi:MAG: glycosyltransferase family 2 protein [Thermoanaerobaculia bacterium]
MIALLFWSCIALIAYVFVGYPLVLAVWSALRPRPWRREPLEPGISVVMAAHNEAASVIPKIENLLSLDYPSELVEILVGSDGSTDGTVDQLLDVSDPRVRVFIFPERRGKPAVLNHLVPRARGEIVVLADVRQKFDAGVLRALTQSFADPEVGAVTGELILTGNEAGAAVSEGSGFYWQYEKFIRSRECMVDSTIVVTGAIYAIRRALFESIPADTIVDDLLIPLRIARRGYRVVFERNARAYDSVPATTSQEFKRKVRTLAGAFQLFGRELWVFNPLRNRLWWQTMSHKVLRLLTAPVQLAALAANVALARGSAFYLFTLLAQILFYVGAIAGILLPRGWKRPLAVTFPYIFCLLSWATVLGFLRWITRRQTVRWEKVTSSFTPN